MATVLFAAECDGRDEAIDSDVVVIDWTGGTNPIYPDDYFEGLDFSAFRTADEGTLADDSEAFMELVRQEVARVYCNVPGASVIVLNGEDDEPADTVVHITQGIPPAGGTDIGEGEYDPCNVQQDNAALVFGERLRQLGGAYTFDEWVTVFANVCAHEIGHTLGYGHVSRGEHTPPARALFVELMLDGHTMAEMRKAHRFIVDQTNCPADSASAKQSVDGLIMTCGSDHATEME